MADEEKTKSESTEQNPVAAKSTLFNTKNIIILVIMLIVLTSIAVIVISNINKNDDTTEPKKEIQKSFKKSMPGYIHTFDTTVVNVSGTQGSRYLKVVVAIELEVDENEPGSRLSKLQDELVARKMQLKDKMNSILSSKVMEQIVNLKERKKIKRDIKDEFNTFLINGKVKNVFFSDFVVQ